MSDIKPVIVDIGLTLDQWNTVHNILRAVCEDIQVLNSVAEYMVDGDDMCVSIENVIPELENNTFLIAEIINDKLDAVVKKSK